MTRRLLRFTVTLALIGFLCVLTAWAQEPAAQDGFVPAGPGDLNQEQIPAARLVFVAYGFVWVVFVFYLFTLWRRMQRVEADIKDLSSRLSR